MEQRTLQEIYNSAIAEKNTLSSLTDLHPNIDSSQTLLSDLGSSSNVAVWRLMLWVMCFVTWWHEKLFYVHKQEIEDRANEIITGTARWYRDQALVFQYGDALAWNGSKFAYPTITTVNQIVKNAAVIEIGGQVRIKVAKHDGAGLPIPLTIPEQTALETYIGKVKFAGTNVAVINRDSDLLQFSIDVYYDPLVMNPDGSLILDPTTFPVHDALASYNQNLPFNGQFSVTEFTDAIQLAEGVVSPIVHLIEVSAAPNPFSVVTDFYVAEAGHMKLNPSTPIASMINYIAYV